MSSIACSCRALNLERDQVVGRETQELYRLGFHRALRGLSTKWLRDHVDEYLVAWDQARERGDEALIARTQAEWKAVWDETDWRDAMASEVAS